MTGIGFATGYIFALIMWERKKYLIQSRETASSATEARLKVTGVTPRFFERHRARPRRFHCCTGQFKNELPTPPFIRLAFATLALR